MKEFFNALYDNIGGKIKALAKAIFIIESIASVIFGLSLIPMEDEGLWWLLGIIIIICGPIVAWASSFFVYGLGELIDKACDIERNTRNNGTKPKVLAKEAKPKAPTKETNSNQAKKDSDRMSQIETLLSLGLITEEEYQQVKSKE